jgi:hypothetical protein
MRNARNVFGGLKPALLAIVVFCAFFVMTGCGLIYYVKPEGTPSNEEITTGYYDMGLKVSTTADAIEGIVNPEYELLSQTKLVIAASGAKKDGYKSWLKLVGFDENEKAARRKCLVIEDEMPKTLFALPRSTAYMEYQMVLDDALKTAPYANQSAKLMAILKDLQKKSGKDIAAVSKDNKTANKCGVIFNQSLYAAIRYLENSAAETENLATTGGVSFSHPSFDKGIIRMGLDYDTATVQIKIGSSAKKWRLSFEKSIQNQGAIEW